MKQILCIALMVLVSSMCYAGSFQLGLSLDLAGSHKIEIPEYAFSNTYNVNAGLVLNAEYLVGTQSL